MIVAAYLLVGLALVVTEWRAGVFADMRLAGAIAAAAALAAFWPWPIFLLIFGLITGPTRR